MTHSTSVTTHHAGPVSEPGLHHHPGPVGDPGPPGGGGTQRLRHLPVQNYPQHGVGPPQQHGVGPPQQGAPHPGLGGAPHPGVGLPQQPGAHPRPPTPHSHLQSPHHHLQSPPLGGVAPGMHQRMANPAHPGPHHLQSPPGVPHPQHPHHMGSSPAMSPHHQMQSPHHHMAPHHNHPQGHHPQGAVPHMMHPHHHQGSPPGVRHPVHPGMYPAGHPQGGHPHQGMLPYQQQHHSGAVPMHHPGAPGHHHPHPHHLQHPPNPQHPASMNNQQYHPHHPHPAAGAPSQHPHPHTPSPHLTPSPHRTPSPGGSLRHQHPTLAQSLGHHHPHPHQGMPHPPHPGHPGAIHGLRSPPPRMPSPHYNHQTQPLTHMTQSDVTPPDAMRQPINPNMCNVQHPTNYLQSPPHGAMLNPTSPAPPRPPAQQSRQRPHASEFMDPNARLKALEDEAPGQPTPGEGPAPPAGNTPHVPGQGTGVEAGDTESHPSAHHPTQVVSVAVPLGWKRVVEAGAVVYYSPSAVRLASIDQLRQYLTTEGTCKCGLECPLLVHKVFNFDPQVASKQWSASESKTNDDLTKLCNHKRKILAMASFHTSQLSRTPVAHTSAHAPNPVTHTPGAHTATANMFNNSAAQLASINDIPENKPAAPAKGVKKRRKKKKSAAAAAVAAALAATQDVTMATTDDASMTTFQNNQFLSRLMNPKGQGHDPVTQILNSKCDGHDPVTQILNPNGEGSNAETNVKAESKDGITVKKEEGVHVEDKPPQDVACVSGGKLTDPLTVNTGAGSEGAQGRNKKAQVSPGTSVFIAEQAKLQQQAGDWQMSEIQKMMGIKKGSKEETEMNKIAAMLNLGPKNSSLAHGMQNALFGRHGNKDSSSGGDNHTHPGAPPSGGAPQQGAPQSGVSSLGPQGAPPGAMNHPHGPRPPFPPPGIPPNMPGIEGMFPGGFPPGMIPPWIEAGLKPKKKAKGRRKKKVNSVLDQTPPCPNVDVRLMHPAMTPGILPPGHVPNNQQYMPGNHGNMHPSFLENPTHFLAQQAAFVNNSLNSSVKPPESSAVHGPHPDLTPDGLPSPAAHPSPSARLTPGRSPAGRSPPAVGRSPPGGAAMSSPAPPSLPSPTSQSTPTHVVHSTPPRSRRSSVSSHHSNTTPSPCVTPLGGVMKSPQAALIPESPGAGSIHDISGCSSASTATAHSCGGSLNQSPTTPVPQSPSSGQTTNHRLNMSPDTPRGSLLPPGVDPKLVIEQELEKLNKSSKSGKLKNQNKASKLNQNQMNLSFSNALEFQQLLASKYSTGSFPASSLLTAAAKAQEGAPGGGGAQNPLTQAISQVQQGLVQQGLVQGKTKGRGRKGAKNNTTANNQTLSATAAKRDDFHASSFLVNDAGTVEGGEALMAALLSNPSLTNHNQAQMLLQQFSNLNGHNNSESEAAAEQLAANHVAMLNMAAASLMNAGNQPNMTGGKDGVTSGGVFPVMTGLDVAHNAILNAFNASNTDCTAKPPTARGKRRRSAPHGEVGDNTPPKCARPRSAPGGGVQGVGGSTMEGTSESSQTVTNLCSTTSPRRATPAPSRDGADGSVGGAGVSPRRGTPGVGEGVPPMSVSMVPAVTNSVTSCASHPDVTHSTVVTPAVNASPAAQLQNNVTTAEQMNQLNQFQNQLQLGVINPQQLNNAQLNNLQINSAQLTGAQLLELQQLVNQQQQLFQGQNQVLQGNDLQQQLMLQAMNNPVLLQQQLAQFQQAGGAVSMDMLAQLQLSQMVMGGMPDQALNAMLQQQQQQQHAVGDKDSTKSGEHVSVSDNRTDNLEKGDVGTTTPTRGRSPRRVCTDSTGDDSGAQPEGLVGEPLTPPVAKKPGGRGGRGRKKDKWKKSNTPTIARMLKAQQGGDANNMGAGLQAVDPSVLLMQNPLLSNNPAALALMAQQSYLSSDTLSIQQAQLQNQMMMLQANMLTGGILGSGIQASLQDVVLQSHLMANMQTTPQEPGQPTAQQTAQPTTEPPTQTTAQASDTPVVNTTDSPDNTAAPQATPSVTAGEPVKAQQQQQQPQQQQPQQQQPQQQPAAVQEGLDLTAMSQAMLQSGMLGAAGAGLDAQTIAALAVGGVVPPSGGGTLTQGALSGGAVTAEGALGTVTQNSLGGMMEVQPDVMTGLPAGISPMAMLQALQLQQQMLKALNPALNFDMTNEQIAQMMSQSGFGMVAMDTQQQQELPVQSQEKPSSTPPKQQQPGEAVNNESSSIKSQAKNLPRPLMAQSADQRLLAAQSADQGLPRPLMAQLADQNPDTAQSTQLGQGHKPGQGHSQGHGSTKEQRGRGRPKKNKRNSSAHSVDMIYDAVVDAAKCGTNVVITEDQDSADKTMRQLPDKTTKDLSTADKTMPHAPATDKTMPGVPATDKTTAALCVPDKTMPGVPATDKTTAALCVSDKTTPGVPATDKTTAAVPESTTPPSDHRPTEAVPSDVVPPLRIVVGAKRTSLGRSPGRPKKKRRKITPRKIVLKSGAEYDGDDYSDGATDDGGDVTGVFESDTLDAGDVTEGVSLEDDEEGERFIPQATCSQGAYPGREGHREGNHPGEEEEDCEEGPGSEPVKQGAKSLENPDQNVTHNTGQRDVTHNAGQRDVMHNIDQRDVMQNTGQRHVSTEQGNVEHLPTMTSPTMTSPTMTSVPLDESGVEMCDSSLEEVRSPCANGLRSPCADGLRSPCADGLRSPCADPGRTPDTDSMRSPFAGGLRSPCMDGDPDPLAGCTPDTDGANHDSDSGIGRDTGGALSEQESMDKSAGSDTLTPNHSDTLTPPNLFDHPLSDDGNNTADPEETGTTPESDPETRGVTQETRGLTPETRELTPETRGLNMEDMSCQTDEELMGEDAEISGEPEGEVGEVHVGEGKDSMTPEEPMGESRESVSQPRADSSEGQAGTEELMGEGLESQEAPFGEYSENLDSRENREIVREHTELCSANQEQEESRVCSEATNQRIADQDFRPVENHVVHDQPISGEEPEPRSDTDNEVPGGENPDELNELEVDARNNNEIVDGGVDSDATDEEECSDDEAPTPLYPRNFNVGDVVWGKIRGFESWPGKLVHESEVKHHHNSKTDMRSPSDNRLWVRWYGGHTFTQEEPETLKTLSEGLEAHHRNTRNHRRGRKLNLNLESAIQEAMNELDRQTALPAGGAEEPDNTVTKVTANRITVTTKRRKTKA